ncbi:zonular occludens toxin domain-containing protein [Ralstonia sp. RRA.1]|uniref:zonular occludens toxin domain-containing protein n=1 Tax=Ralstonia sp. RRA TaxID=3122075 RepID=UPI0030CF0C54
MQINIFGKPGDGKTYSTVFFVGLFALAAGRRWVSNINGIDAAAINGYLNALPGRATSSDKTDALDHTERRLLKLMREQSTATGDYDFKALILNVDEEDVKKPDFWYSPDFPASSITQPGDVITVDEARRYFGSGMKVPERTIMLILKHRHYVDARGYSMDLYFIAQQPGHLQREVSGNAQFTYVARRMLSAGKYKQKKFRLDYYEGAIGLTDIKRGDYYDGVEETLNPRIFSLYKSFEGTNGFEASNNTPTIWNVKFWGLPLFKFWIPLSFVALVWGAYYMYHFFFSGADIIGTPLKTKPAAISGVAGLAQPKAITPPLPAPVPSADPTAGESTLFRLTGFYKQQGYTFAILSDKDNRIRYVSDFEYIQTGLAPTIKWHGSVISYWTGPVAAIPQLKEKNDEKKSNIFAH